MTIVNSISSFLEDQRKLIRDFYHLDYWDDHTLSEGFSEALDGVAEMVEEASEGKSSFVQASAGAGMGLARLIGGIPICLNEWGIQVAKEIPRGPGAALYKFVEIPVSGVVHGITYIGDSFSNWSHGSLNNQDSFSIAQEVTSVLGAAVFISHGAKSISKGGGKFINSVKSAAQEMSVISLGNGMAVATVGIQGALTLAGGADIFSGIVWMSSTGESGGTRGEENVEAPKAVQENSGGVITRRSFQSLLEKYGAEILKAKTAGGTVAFNFRLTEGERMMLKNLSKTHNVNATLVIRIAIKVLIDALEAGENLFQRYSEEILVSFKAPNRNTKTVNFRIGSSEMSNLELITQKHNIQKTTAAKLAIRLLKETLEFDRSVRSPAPSLTMEALQSPFFPGLHRSKFLEIVSGKLGERVTHVQKTGDNTVVVITESGAAYEAKCEVVYEHIELRKMTPEK